MEIITFVQLYLYTFEQSNCAILFISAYLETLFNATLNAVPLSENEEILVEISSIYFISYSFNMRSSRLHIILHKELNFIVKVQLNS